MKDKEPLYTRYPDLFQREDANDPALHQLVNDLETLYPPVSYPTHLPERLFSALEEHIELHEPASAERLAEASERSQAGAISERSWSVRETRRRSERSGSRRRWWSTLAAAALTMLLVGSLLLVLRASHQPASSSSKPTRPVTAPDSCSNSVTGTPSIGAGSTSMADLRELSGIHMMNATTGWAQARGGAVLHTSDGGLTWRVVQPQGLGAILPDPQAIGPIVFEPISACSAWAKAENIALQAALFHTTNGGQSWQQIMLPASIKQIVAANGGYLFDLSFVNDFLGVVSTIDPRSGAAAQDAWLTRDGGLTWTKLTRPASTNNWNGLVLFDAQTWMLSPNKTQVNSTNQPGAPSIYITHNAGRDWRKETLTLPANMNLASSSAYAQAFSATDGVLVIGGEGGNFLAYITHDGGDTWHATTPLSAEPGQGAYILDFPRFSSISDGQDFDLPIPEYVSLPANLYMVVTHDSGQTWHVLKFNLPTIAKAQPGLSRGDSWDWNFISPQVGWLTIDYAPTDVGLPQSGLYKTTDGGQTWNPVNFQIG